MVAASHMWIFKLNFELNLNKTEDNPSISPVTFQVLSSHMWQVATVLANAAVKGQRSG